MAAANPDADLLDIMTQKIVDLTALPDDSVALKLLNRFDKKKVFGDALDAQIPFQTGHAGRIGRSTAGGALAVGLSSTAIKGKIPVVKNTLGLSFDDEDLRKMEGGRPGLHTTLSREIKGAMKKFKLHQERLMFGDGSGCIARVDGVHSTVTEIKCSGPILGIEDDEIRGYTNRGGGSAGTQTATRRIVDVDHKAGYLYLDAAAVGFADNECVFLYNGHDTSATKFQSWPMGFQGHIAPTGDGLDTTAGNSIWDLDNASGYYMVTTYQSLARSTAAHRKMMSGAKDAAGAQVSPYWVAYGVGALVSKGVKAGSVALLMSDKMLARIAELYMGTMQMSMTKLEVQIPGGLAKNMPVITIGGLVQVPVLATPWVLDGSIVTINLGDYEQVAAKGGWVGRNGQKMHLAPTSGAATYNHTWLMHNVFYWNTGCLAPSKQYVVYGLDTTEE